MDNKSAIIDTNILIMICRSKSEANLFLESKGIIYSFITPLSYFEFLGGAKANQKRWAEKFLQSFQLCLSPKKAILLAKPFVHKMKLELGN